MTTYLTTGGAAGAIEFYKKVFGAEELVRMPGPNGKVDTPSSKSVIPESRWRTSSPTGGRRPQNPRGVSRWLNPFFSAKSLFQCSERAFFIGEPFFRFPPSLHSCERKKSFRTFSMDMTSMGNWTMFGGLTI
jgi:hypothetical protein